MTKEQCQEDRKKHQLTAAMAFGIVGDISPPQGCSPEKR
jgi:hypothetical protein